MLRVQWVDDSIMTIVTTALMLKFSLVWGDQPLKCSADPDALARLPEILVWLEAAVPRARNLARRMFDIACYVDWCLRKTIVPFFAFDPGDIDALGVDPR